MWHWPWIENPRHYSIVLANISKLIFWMDWNQYVNQFCLFRVVLKRTSFFKLSRSINKTCVQIAHSSTTTWSFNEVNDMIFIFIFDYICCKMSIVMSLWRWDAASCEVNLRICSSQLKMAVDLKHTQFEITVNSTINN